MTPEKALAWVDATKCSMATDEMTDVAACGTIGAMVANVLASRCQHPGESLRCRVRSRFARTVARSHNFVPRLPIPRTGGFLDRPIADDQEAPGLHIASTGRKRPCLQDSVQQRARHRVRLQAAHRARGAHDLEEIEFRGCHIRCLQSAGGVARRASRSVSPAGVRVSTHGRRRVRKRRR